MGSWHRTLLEQRFDRFDVGALEHDVRPEPPLDLASNLLRASFRVHVRVEPIPGNLQRAQRGVVPLRVQPVALLDPRDADRTERPGFIEVGQDRTARRSGYFKDRLVGSEFSSETTSDADEPDPLLKMPLGKCAA